MDVKRDILNLELVHLLLIPSIPVFNPESLQLEQFLNKLWPYQNTFANTY